ncbi:homoserine kinase [uncultured Thermanaerothrix sp.]|uniref:homoserine kinase n=1 Tax=uncultured Thermanaerothrix sp. TaxID=1195149 RepID=UPI002607C268|nr:homoserine kinase [uncultured Thermanaerothrix sp.]
MSEPWIHVRVPATTANLGPGFDTLGLALDLWNEAWVRPAPSVQVRVFGEGVALPLEANRMVQAIHYFYQRVVGHAPPPLEIVQYNRIPLSSGLGSSAAAALSGLLAAGALSGHLPDTATLLRLATDLEGHADNAAAALLGGLVVVISEGDDLFTHRFTPAPWQVAIALPNVALSTAAARAALPRQIPLEQAVYNLGRTALVVQALLQGDLTLLRRAMRDRLHQPYRLPLIPGAADAIERAVHHGAAAALSGAGPSVIAFAHSEIAVIANAMQAAFRSAGVDTRTWTLALSPSGATWAWIEAPTIPSME